MTSLKFPSLFLGCLRAGFLMLRSLHMSGTLCSPHFYRFTLFRSSVLATMGQHPIPPAFMLAMRMSIGRKIVNIGEIFFAAPARPQIIVTSQQFLTPRQVVFRIKTNNAVWVFRFSPSGLHLKNTAAPFLGIGSKLHSEL